MCPCSVLRADGGRPAGHNASSNASTGTRSPTRAASAASSVCSARRNRTTEVPSNSSTGPRTRTSTSGDRTHRSAKSTANTATARQPLDNRAERPSESQQAHGKDTAMRNTAKVAAGITTLIGSALLLAPLTASAQPQTSATTSQAGSEPSPSAMSIEETQAVMDAYLAALVA